MMSRHIRGSGIGAFIIGIEQNRRRSKDRLVCIVYIHKGREASENQFYFHRSSSLKCSYDDRAPPHGGGAEIGIGTVHARALRIAKRVGRASALSKPAMKRAEKHGCRR